MFSNLKSSEYLKHYQNYEISNYITSEIEQFETNPIHYVIQNNHDICRTNQALNHIKSYNSSEGCVEYITHIQVCLSKFELNKSYSNTLELCINNINEQDSLNLYYTWFSVPSFFDC